MSADHDVAAELERVSTTPSSGAGAPAGGLGGRGEGRVRPTQARPAQPMYDSPRAPQPAHDGMNGSPPPPPRLDSTEPTLPDQGCRTAARRRRDDAGSSFPVIRLIQAARPRAPAARSVQVRHVRLTVLGDRRARSWRRPSSARSRSSTRRRRHSALDWLSPVEFETTPVESDLLNRRVRETGSTSVCPHHV